MIQLLEYLLQLNHILRTRDIVTKNDTKVSKRQENAKEDITNSDSFLDHGFTRPKVKVLSSSVILMLYEFGNEIT